MVGKEGRKEGEGGGERRKKEEEGGDEGGIETAKEASWVNGS